MSGVNLVQAGNDGNMQELIAANSTYLDFGDFVTINSSGFMARTAATEKIDGIYQGVSTTFASDNQTVAQAKVKYLPINDDMMFEMTSDQACTQTDVGAYADVALSTNAFVVNLAAGASGQLYVVDFDPNRDGSTSTVRVQVAEPQQLAFAQA